ncbi:MAG: hypothetical protein IPO32_07970 [Crocinitomicaceae bacterium]|nr:hypothetical protein [Crocinitomicaceae bacterium]MBK9591431.1 hypothetical protein [Crocinitomicaceae bacterium]
MRKVFFFFIVLTCYQSKAQLSDSLLQGQWNLFKIIDNLTGDELAPPVHTNPDFKYYISFGEDSLVKFNLEINKCGNSYTLPATHQIKFLFYSECTKICCDKEFSALLTYEDCTNYYIKNDNTLILVSEDRMYYFKRAE